MSFSEQSWEAGVDAYRGLGELGFTLTIDWSGGRAKVARFSSRELFLEYAFDTLTGDINTQWRDCASGKGIPDPIYAICYFSLSLSDLDGDFISRHDGIRARIDLYKRNKWALASTEWAGDSGFVRALNAAYAWAWKEFRPLETFEFERVLILHRERSIRMSHEDKD